MFCHKCGEENLDSAQFCKACGEKLYSDPAQYTSQPNFQNQSPYPPQPQPYQYPYPNQPYQQPYGDEMQRHHADNAATASLICGIIGIFFFGLILGVIAIVQGNRAKSLGYPGGKATAGIILGIIGLIGWALIMFYNFYNVLM